MPTFAAWSDADVLTTLMRSAKGPRSRAAIVGYYASRSRRLSAVLPRALRQGAAAVHLSELAAPLHCNAESGGLAVYYEIVTRAVYTPTPAWIPRPGDTVVDAGANIGVFSLWAANAVGPEGCVAAFEPNPLAFELLVQNTNTLPFVVCRQVALGDATNKLVLHYPPGRLSVGSFEQRPDRTESAEVDVVQLDDALSVEGPIALLKVDVEGFEAQVLRGASVTLARTTRVVLEVAGTRLAECEHILSASGLRKVGQTSGMWNISERHGVIAYFERT